MNERTGIKVVINIRHGGFALSSEAIELYAKKKGIGLGNCEPGFDTYENLAVWDIDRDDKCLVEVVEELGSKANGRYAELKVIELPSDVADRWYIEDYDGLEWISEEHRTWR